MVLAFKAIRFEMVIHALLPIWFETVCNFSLSSTEVPALLAKKFLALIEILELD